MVSQFGLFLDDQETLRSKERINETSLLLSTKVPAMLPSKHWFTELVIRDTHEVFEIRLQQLEKDFRLFAAEKLSRNRYAIVLYAKR